LQTAVPTFLKVARAGERLLVRNNTNDAWIVQSVSAYKGFIIDQGDCGFHVLKVPDDKQADSKSKKKAQKPKPMCFKGMQRNLKGDPIMQVCNAKLTFWKTTHADFKGQQYQFSFGSKRCAGSVHTTGRLYKAEPTRQQAFHTDGPVKVASVWRADSTFNIKGDANQMQDLRVSDTSSWFLSALCAFFDLTALGVLGGEGKSLRLDIPIGQCVLFRFDFLHHGWKCANPHFDLPVHFRAHFYLFCGSLRELPVPDFEAALEFLCCLSHDGMDDGTKLLLLECLQTFVPDLGRKSLKQEAQKRGYHLFDNQDSLDQLGKQSEARPSSKKRKR
jgi:hypothetical protein